MPDIFLSYNREDQTAARRFAEAFQAQGLDVWWDTALTPGEAYDQVTEKALKEARAVVVLWSKKSVDSRWVRAEATLADRNKTLVPVMIEPCERPIMFELTQTAELAHWQGDRDDKAWQTFLASLKRFVETRPQLPAPTKVMPTLAQIVSEPEKPPETMLAVLPFDNLSSDAEMQFFSDGVSEDILGRIMRGSKLKVIGRTSSFQFRGADKPKAAAALKATHILDGSIRRAGSKVRIAAHLTEAASQTTLWSDKYDRSLEDIFAVQDEISEAIAEALNAAFFPERTAKIDAAAYDLYLRARDWTSAVEEMRKSIAMLENVTHIAPEFAAGWGSLAARRAQLRMQMPYSDRVAITALTNQEIARALALEPGNVAAIGAQFSLLDPFGQFLEGEELVAGTTGDSFDGRQDFQLLMVGRFREAILRGRSGYDRDPLNEIATVSHGRNLWFGGRFAEARAILQRTLSLWPGDHHAITNLLMLNAFEKDWAGVDAILDPEQLAKFPLRELRGARRFVEVMRDPTPERRVGFFSAIKTRAQGTGHADHIALVMAAHLGFTNEAYELLESTRLGPSGGPSDALGADAYRTYFLFIAAFPELRADPRFVKLCARLGLVEYWLARQQWPDCVEQVPYDFKAECEKHRNTPKDRFFA